MEDMRIYELQRDDGFYILKVRKREENTFEVNLAKQNEKTKYCKTIFHTYSANDLKEFPENVNEAQIYVNDLLYFICELMNLRGNDEPD